MPYYLIQVWGCVQPQILDTAYSYEELVQKLKQHVKMEPYPPAHVYMYFKYHASSDPLTQPSVEVGAFTEDEIGKEEKDE